MQFAFQQKRYQKMIIHPSDLLGFEQSPGENGEDPSFWTFITRLDKTLENVQ